MNFSVVFQIESKITLGIVGILVILASVFASIGILGYAKYATSLIVIEVVPFLVLAIGADNVFILTLEYEVSTSLFPYFIHFVFYDMNHRQRYCTVTFNY